MPKYFVSQLNSLQASTLFTLATVGLALSAVSSASAAAIGYNFKIDFSPGSGSLSGTTTTGMFEIDNSFLVSGNGQLSPANGLNSLMLSIAGQNYTETDDSSYPLFPSVQFSNSKPVGLSFLVSSTPPLLNLSIDNTSVDFNDGGSTGTIVSFSQKTFTPTPEPSSLIGLPLILGLGFLSKKRKSQ